MHVSVWARTDLLMWRAWPRTPVHFTGVAPGQIRRGHGGDCGRVSHPTSRLKGAAASRPIWLAEPRRAASAECVAACPLCIERNADELAVPGLLASADLQLVGVWLA